MTRTNEVTYPLEVELTYKDPAGEAVRDTITINYLGEGVEVRVLFYVAHCHS